MPASAPRPNRSVLAALPDPSPDFTPLLSERHVALAVSGGSDSTALMHLAKDWASACHPQLKLSVLTVDHRLRPDSAAEAQAVGKWAAALGLEHQLLSWGGPKPQSGLQAKARAARYNLMSEWCRAHDGSLLLTGHTLDDQAETVAMRLGRTGSPESLAGIPRLGEWQGVPLFRPLLACRRVALRDYLSARGQGWVEDPSNTDPRFERVRMRQGLVDLDGHGITPGRLARLAEDAARTSALIDDLATRWTRRWLAEEEAGICHLPSEPFLALPPALQQRILGRILRHYGGGGFAPEPEELRRLMRFIEAGPVRCTLAGALIGRRKRGVWITREAGRIPREPLTVPETGEALWDGRFRVTAAPGARVRAAGAENRDPASLGPDVPVFARRAFPVVEQPPGAPGEPRIAFVRLAPP